MPQKRKAYRGTATVADTNVFIHDPDSINILRKENGTLIIPMAVIRELEGLRDKVDIGFDVRESLRRIETAQLGGDPSIHIHRRPSFRNLNDLNPSIADHQIIATANTVQHQGEYATVRLISKDLPVRIIAREVGLSADDYLEDQVTLPKYTIKELEVPIDLVDMNSCYFPYQPFADRDIKENEGVICHSDFGEYFPLEGKKTFAAIRKNDFFHIIPDDIRASGIKPYSLNGNGPNWSQYIALQQLLDPTIQLVFLQGGAGTGKTLLALAAAIEQRKNFQQIVITRPLIPLEDEDRVGFLPGDLREKLAPWFKPIEEGLSFIKESNQGNKRPGMTDELLQEGKIIFENMDYIRGRTVFRKFLLVDEGQNLTPHQVKTIITRSGMYSKIVFTGDLGQIDRRRRLDEKTSGLAFGIARMNDHPMVAVTNFKETVRSPLANLAEERM